MNTTADRATVEAEARAKARALATAAQLDLEIRASKYRYAKAVAEALDMNYTTLTGNLNGKSPIKLQTLFRVLDLIGLEPDVFFGRVSERTRQG